MHRRVSQFRAERKNKCQSSCSYIASVFSAAAGVKKVVTNTASAVAHGISDSIEATWEKPSEVIKMTIIGTSLGGMIGFAGGVFVPGQIAWANSARASVNQNPGWCSYDCLPYGDGCIPTFACPQNIALQNSISAEASERGTKAAMVTAIIGAGVGTLAGHTFGVKKVLKEKYAKLQSQSSKNDLSEDEQESKYTRASKFRF